MDFDKEMTIFWVSMLIFFVTPVAIILTAVVADWRARLNDQMTTDHPDQMTSGCHVTKMTR